MLQRDRANVPLTPAALLGYAHACDAAARVRAGDSDGAAWVWFRSMNAEARAGFATYLAQTQHPSAYTAGTAVGRFRDFVAELVDAGL